MRDPKDVHVAREKATYILPYYKVTEEGLTDAGVVQFKFVKGAKDDPRVFRQEGFVTETIVVTLKKFLEENNVGDLKDEYTPKMIEKFGEILELIDKRAEDRRNRGVQGTYKK